jgi:hypothetical protein
MPGVPRSTSGERELELQQLHPRRASSPGNQGQVLSINAPPLTPKAVVGKMQTSRVGKHVPNRAQ